MRSLNPALPADPRLTYALNIISQENILNLFIYSFVSLNMADDISATGTRYQVLPYSSVCAPVRIMSNCCKILNVLSTSDCCIGSWAYPLLTLRVLNLFSMSNCCRILSLVQQWLPIRLQLPLTPRPEIHSSIMKWVSFFSKSHLFLYFPFALGKNVSELFLAWNARCVL